MAAASVILTIMVSTACNTSSPTERRGVQVSANNAVSEAQAREIAEADARNAYRDLSPYKVSARLADGKWYIDYELIDETLLGGGPHYVISAQTGEVLSKRYEQ
jgi:hypothetical protein